MKDRLIIFDTTLRDGEQSPGASLGMREKQELASQLVRLGVDVIEAGFPVASPGDFEAVRLIASTVKGPVIAGLARAVKKDIDAAYKAVGPARAPRIHVFLATSRVHMKYKLKKPEREVLRQAVFAVKYAKRYVKDVEFSPEDAARTDPEFLRDVVEAVIKAGALTVNIPDTVGYAMPAEFGGLIKWLRESITCIDKAVLSVHCHNDLGLAVGNSLAAVSSGARQVECTINGIGERAGNAALEEIVMAVKTRKDFFGISTKIDTKQIVKTSRLLSRLTGIAVQPNKAVVGGNAFAHEAGIHQDGILKKPSTYEIMRPADVGFCESRLVLGKHSGRHAFKERLMKLGYKISRKEMEKAFERFKLLADKKKTIYDEDLETIIEEQISDIPEMFKLVYFSVVCGNCTIPTATVQLKRGADIFEEASSGDGPIDAAYKAVDKIISAGGRLIDYTIKAVTGGKDAMGEVVIRRSSAGGAVYIGRGSSTDIIEASIKAYLNAINRSLYRPGRKKKGGRRPSVLKRI